MDWTRITDWIKLKPRYLFPLFLASSLLLFASPSFLETLGVANLVEDFRGWIGGAWIVTGSVLFTHAVRVVARPFQSRFAEWRRVRALRRRIPQLSPEELAVLALYIDSQKSTLVLPISSGVPGSLEAKKIIFRSSTISTGRDYFAYTVQPWAWEYLSEHPELLQRGREFPLSLRGF